jgi:hypothetical protein
MTPIRIGQKPGPQPAPLVAVSATFTAESMGETLSFWLRRLGLDLPVRFAPYNQVFQQLLDPLSLLTQNQGGINVVLARLEDLVRFQNAPAPNLDSLEENARYLVSCLQSVAECSASSFVVSVCPASPGFLADPARAAFAERMTQHIETSLSGPGTVYVIPADELDRLYPVSDKHDPHGDELGHIPYTAGFFTALGSLIARKIHTLRATPYSHRARLR